MEESISNVRQENVDTLTDQQQDEAICCDKGYKNLESRQVAKNESESVESNVNMIETSEIDCDSFTVETHQANIEEEMRNNLPPPPPQNGVEAESFQNFHSLSAVLVAEVDSAEPPPSSQQGESQLSVPPCETETTDQSAQSQEQNHSAIGAAVPPFKKLKKDENSATNSEASSSSQVKAPPFKVIKTASDASKPPFPKKQGAQVKPPFKAVKAANSVAKALKRVQNSAAPKTGLGLKVGSVTDARLRARALRGGQLTYLDRVKLRLGSGTNSIPVGAERVAGASANVLRLKEMSGADGNPNRMPIGPRRMLPPVADPRELWPFHHEHQELATVRTSLGNESLSPGIRSIAEERPPLALGPYAEERPPYSDEYERELEILRRRRIEDERELEILRKRRQDLAPRLPEREIATSPRLSAIHGDEYHLGARQPPIGYEGLRDREYDPLREALALRDSEYARDGLVPREDPMYARSLMARDAHLFPEERELLRRAGEAYPEDPYRDYYYPARRDFLEPRNHPYGMRPPSYALGYAGERIGVPPYMRLPPAMEHPSRDPRRLEALYGPLNRHSSIARDLPPRAAAASAPKQNVVSATKPASPAPFKKPAPPPFKQPVAPAPASDPPFKKAAPPPFKQPTVSEPPSSPSSASGRGVTAIELIDTQRRVLKRQSDDELINRGGRNDTDSVGGPSVSATPSSENAPFTPRTGNAPPPFASRQDSAGWKAQELIVDRSPNQ